MSYQLIDMTKDPRSGQFACFRQMLFPFAGVTAEVDITDFARPAAGTALFSGLPLCRGAGRQRHSPVAPLHPGR